MSTNKVTRLSPNRNRHSQIDHVLFKNTKIHKISLYL